MTNESVGSALARFERSTLPDHKNTRTIVLRFLEIITPVKCAVPLYDGRIVVPKEGELYRRSRTQKAIDILNPPVWSIDIDNTIATKGKGNKIQAFQLLWDV
jgi:hypothetical protein